MGSDACFYCENIVRAGRPFCGRCGGRPSGESAAVRAVSKLGLVERSIHDRAWFGLAKEIDAVRTLLDAGALVDPACGPALARLMDEVRRRLTLEPDLPRVIGLARSVLGLVRGGGYPEIRARVDALDRFARSLAEADREWGQGRPPSQKKALAWLEVQAGPVGMTVDDARESIYETPERWRTLASTIDPEMFQAVRWKVEVAEAEARILDRDHGPAGKVLVAVLARDEGCSRAHEALARVLQAQGKTGPAVEHLRAAVRAGDAPASAWNSLAWHLATGGDPDEAALDEAAWAAHRAIALAPRAACWDTLAEVLHRQGDLPGAIAAAREAIRLDPDRPSLRDRMRSLCSALPSDPASAPGAKSAFDELDLESDDADEVDLELDDADDRAVESDPDEITVADPSSDFDLDASELVSEFEATPIRGGLDEGESGEFSADEDESDETTNRVLDSSRIAGGPPSKPVTVTDRVQFSLTAPSTLEPGGSYALDVWAYVKARRVEMMARARESQGTDDLRVKTKDGVVVARGVILAVRLTIPSLVVADPEDEIAWDGTIGNATFPVSVPAEARPGPHAGSATFHVDQFAIAKLHFVLEVGRGAEAVALMAAREVRCKCAFASYASEDRDEVLGRLQGIMKVLPDLDLFLDVASLRSGERWEERLHQEITRRETLYLFWSLAASRSPWVEREWRIALALRGIEGIDPVPLVSPEEVPPPPELARHLHFNDRLLAFSRARRTSEST